MVGERKDKSNPKTGEVIFSLMLALMIAINVISTCFGIGLLVYFTTIIFVFVFIYFSQTKQVWKECGFHPILFKIILIVSPVLFAITFLLAVITY